MSFAAPCVPPLSPFQVLSFTALGRPDGAPAEVLAIALALVTLDVRSGGVVRPLDTWVERVLADSSGYVDGAAWISPCG